MKQLFVFLLVALVTTHVASECCEKTLTDCVFNGIQQCCYNLRQAPSTRCKCLVLSVAPQYGLSSDEFGNCVGVYTYDVCLGVNASTYAKINTTKAVKLNTTRV